MLGADGLVYQSIEDLVSVGRELNPAIHDFDDSPFTGRREEGGEGGVKLRNDEMGIARKSEGNLKAATPLRSSTARPSQVAGPFFAEIPHSVPQLVEAPRALHCVASSLQPPSLGHSTPRCAYPHLHALKGRIRMHTRTRRPTHLSRSPPHPHTSTPTTNTAHPHSCPTQCTCTAEARTHSAAPGAQANN